MKPLTDNLGIVSLLRVAKMTKDIGHFAGRLQDASFQHMNRLADLAHTVARCDVSVV